MMQKELFLVTINEDITSRSLRNCWFGFRTGGTQARITINNILQKIKAKLLPDNAQFTEQSSYKNNVCHRSEN
jgi:hypothetical protein